MSTRQNISRSALSQGMISSGNTALAPSLRALGPNTYLGVRDFLMMLGIALLLHVAAFVVAALLPDDSVKNIPVQALSFKLGDEAAIAAYAPPAAAVPEIAAPVMEATEDAYWQPSASQPAPETPAPLVQEKPKAKPAEPKKKKKREAEAKPEQKPAPAISESPQQYVREVGGAANASDASTAPSNASGSTSEQVAREVRSRYEQQISAWIQRHKIYPADGNGREGRAVLRVRIDRAGNVRYYAIEQTSGTTALDAAAMDMIRRANPVPAVPANYPDGSMVEFLIPITFKAPQ